MKIKTILRKHHNHQAKANLRFQQVVDKAIEEISAYCKAHACVFHLHPTPHITGCQGLAKALPPELRKICELTIQGNPLSSYLPPKI